MLILWQNGGKVVFEHAGETAEHVCAIMTLEEKRLAPFFTAKRVHPGFYLNMV